MSEPCLESERLRLRPIEEGDVRPLHRLFTDPDVRRFLWDDLVIEVSQVEEILSASRQSFRQEGFGQWAVLPRQSEELIGFCGLRPFEEPTSGEPGAVGEPLSGIELLYGLAPAWWGRGLATEAARAVLRYAFDGCGLDRVYAGADLPNAASFAVMERLGMRPLRRLELEPGPALYYVLTREEGAKG